MGFMESILISEGSKGLLIFYFLHTGILNPSVAKYGRILGGEQESK